MALPLKGVMLSYTDTTSARRGEGHACRGAACAATSTSSARPPAARIADVKVDTSVRKGQITFDAALRGPRRRRPRTPSAPGSRGTAAPVTEFTSQAFTADDLKDGRFTFTERLEARPALGPPHAREHRTP